MLSIRRHAIRHHPTRLLRPLSSSSSSSSSPPVPLASTYFPCLDENALREERLLSELSAASRRSEGAEPVYGKITGGYRRFSFQQPFACQHGGTLGNGFDIAYETWGTLNADRSNAILLHTGLSASSHAKSHRQNTYPGWWEAFIGPGKSLDTNKFFVICTNVLGSCYGSTGPSSTDPRTGKPYATTFPTVSIMDMVRAQRILLEQEFQLPFLHASVGASMGGMQSLAMACLYPSFVRKCISISACARSHPYSIAMRSVQRVVLMNDPNWRRGFYYPEFTEPDEPTPRVPPHTGMKLARMISTIGYRSGPEWESRFGRKKMSNEEREQERQRLGIQHPHFCSEFLVETYLENQGEKFRLQYDANSLLYVSKAMDMFDLSLSESDELPKESTDVEYIAEQAPPVYDTNAGAASVDRDLTRGFSRIEADTLVLGVQSDILFPVTQQKEIADYLREGKKARTTYYELDSIFGHDTFLVDVTNTGAAVKGHLERDCS